MNVQALSNLFATTYDPNPNTRKAGELEIRKIGKEEGMVTAVLQIIGNDGVDIATRQACAVYLKNRVHNSYVVDTTRQRPDQLLIPESDRNALKASIFPLIIASPSKAISSQLANTLRTIVSHDFPDQWLDLSGTIKTLLSSRNVREVTAGCTAILEVIKVFRYRQDSSVLLVIVHQTFPLLVEIGSQLLSTTPSGPSQDIPTILHYILKTYRNSIILQLSRHQQSHDSIVPWGRLLFQIINLQVPNEGVPENEDEREKCEWWKAKKWAYSVLGRLFHRYGNPSQLPSTLKKEYAAFAEHFVTNFAPEIMKTYLHQVELLVSGQQWLSKKCQYHIFLFFTECVKPKSTWVLLRPHFQTLVSSFVFPQMCFTPIKQELWESDPVEYTRTVIDEYEDFAAPVSAATSFLFALASSRTKTTFLPILQFINQVLGSNALPAQRFGALNMMSALGHFMMRHPQVRPSVEQFVLQHVLPEFSSSMPYMRAIACEFITTIEKNNMQWASDDNLANVSRAVAGALDDAELPVRVHAALALTEMITVHESVQAAVRPQVGKVIQDLLKLSDETDMDVLNSSMEIMVERYHAELLPVAAQLTARLCESYLRLMRENLAQESSIQAESDFDKSVDSTSGDDDKTFAAMGVAKTLSTIISSVDSAPEILGQVEEIIVPIIVFTLDNKMLDLFDNMYDLVDALTFNLRRISGPMWQVYELTYRLFKADAIDFLDEMLPSLDNFISFGSDVIKGKPEYKMMILDIYTTAMTSEQLGENDRVDACKLIESFLLNLRGHVDDALQTIIGLALAELEKVSSKSMRLSNLETLINAVLYNPPAALHLMETISLGSSRRFFDKWFTTLRTVDGFPRVHDKKLSIVTMCALLEMDPASVPASLHEGWVGIVSAILHVFQGLPEAVEKRKALEEAFTGDDDDGDDDGAPEDILNLEDDDGDVWDEDSAYIEMLAKEGERLRYKADSGVAIAGDESESESDDESLDEELGFTSPLDNVDPYVSFKQALTTFQMKNTAGYQAATTSLNIEQQTSLMEIMAIAEKNANAATSA